MKIYRGKGGGGKREGGVRKIGNLIYTAPIYLPSSFSSISYYFSFLHLTFNDLLVLILSYIHCSDEADLFGLKSMLPA